MGNLVSASGQNLATVAVSNYMSITKNQVVQIRNEVLALTNQEGKIRRHFFAIAVAKARVAIYPDLDILDALFAMWDLTGDSIVPAQDFVAGFCVLACPNHSLADVLKFAMEIIDLEESELITTNELVNLLKSITLTASFFGDRVLETKQVYEVVDGVFDCTAPVYESTGTISHQECIQLLLKEPLVRKMVKTTPEKTTPFPTDRPFVKTRLEDESIMSTDVSSVGLSPYAIKAKQSGAASRQMSSYDESSIRLYPLAKINLLPSMSVETS
jgi:Ca2+-binding EF-hand superfamily protein